MANVTVYSTASCPFCKKAEEYLKHNDVSFDVKKVDEDRDAASEMINKSGQQGVPVLDIDGEIIIGFKKPEIDKALGL